MTRRGLQITLGVLWLIDAGLQLQPYMFSTRFATEVLAPAGRSQASFVSAPVDHVSHIVGQHPVAFNVAFASLQLAIGVGLLLRRAVVPSLIASIVWSLTVWYLGEGLGGLTGPNAALLLGAPGAALLYAVLAAAAWPDDSDDPDQQPKAWLAFAWAGYWIGGAILQIWHGPRIGPDLAATVAEGANGAPGWLSRFDFSVARNLTHVSPAVVEGFIVLQVLIGLAVFGPARSRQVAAVVGSAICCGFWILGPGFSQFVSGHATDPNTAPLIVVLAVAVVASASRPTMDTVVVSRRSKVAG
ncbi:MAG TPA: hypothetical protein VII50_07715 [Acidothermaceae bacterium]